jgi:hypothetical protein
VYRVFAPPLPRTVSTSANPRSLELGMPFQTKGNGYATGMRFYKAPGNSGVHVGTLWSAQGSVLARATFGGESASGWQHANFSSPVPLAALKSYVVSYHAPHGHFSYSANYFSRAVSPAMLRAPASTTQSPNGVYAYAATSVFPTASGKGMNYWVDIDVVRSLAVPPATTTTTAPTTTTTTTAATTTTTTAPTTTTTTAPTTTTTTVASTTTTAPSTTTTVGAPGPDPGAPSSPPALVCGNHSLLDGPASAPAGAVVIPAGDNNTSLGTDWNIQANTTYYLAPGVHTLGTSSFSQIIPKDNDRFIGAPGAILDGQGANMFAFTQHANAVTVAYLEIRGFNAPHDQGVVNHDSANNWTVAHNYVHDNHGAALMTGANNTVAYNCLDHNGQYGINATGNPAVNLVVDHNEISRNNADNVEAQMPGCGCTGGVKFWNVNGATVTNNYVHDNASVGLWADTNDRGFDIEHNYVSGNWGEGILYEISYNAYIHDNTLTRNAWGKGPTNPGFPTGAIYISESGGDARVAGGRYSTMEVSGNVLTDNWSGVVMWESADRFCGSPNNASTGYCTLVNTSVANIQTCNPANINNAPYYDDCRWKTQNVSVHDNTFNLNPANVPGCAANTGCGYNGVFSQSGTSPGWSPYKGNVIKDAITYHQNNGFANNTYNGPWTFMAWDQGTKLSFSAWQGAPYNEDANSTLHP